jgi:hypothetical protein
LPKRHRVTERQKKGKTEDLYREVLCASATLWPTPFS